LEPFFVVFFLVVRQSAKVPYLVPFGFSFVDLPLLDFPDFAVFLAAILFSLLFMVWGAAVTQHISMGRAQSDRLLAHACMPTFRTPTTLLRCKGTFPSSDNDVNGKDVTLCSRE
jgi:hypothetical protein